MKKLNLEAQAEVFEEQDLSKLGHPYLTYAKYTFTDDKPNRNKQGVKYEDFPLLAKSAIDMPVKLRWLGKGVGGHHDSKPIGHIKEIEEHELEDGSHQLVAYAALYSEEFPKEIKYLREKYDSGDSPMVSWELGYERDELENGTTWKRKPIAKASTFVRDGAYGTRATLLALASSEGSEEELGRELQALASTIAIENGGSTVDEKKEQEYKDRIAQLEQEVTTLKTASDQTQIQLKDAQAELEQKETVIQQFATDKLVEDRVRVVIESGLKLDSDPVKLQAKQAFLASLTEEAFAEYVTDIKSVVDANKSASTSKTAFASMLPTAQILRPAMAAVEPTTMVDIKTRMKNASRGISTAE